MNINEIYGIKSSDVSKLYAIKDITTGKYITNLTNPGHKFWEVKGHCINALNSYKNKYNNLKNKENRPNPNNLKIIEYTLFVEKYLDDEELKK